MHLQPLIGRLTGKLKWQPPYVPAPTPLRPPRCLTASPAGLPEASSVPSPAERTRGDTVTLQHTLLTCQLTFSPCGGKNPPVLYFGFLPPVCWPSPKPGEVRTALLWGSESTCWWEKDWVRFIIQFYNSPASAVPLTAPSWTSTPAPLPPRCSADVSAFLPEEQDRQNVMSCGVWTHIKITPRCVFIYSTHSPSQPGQPCTFHIQPAESRCSLLFPSVSRQAPETTGTH